MDTTSSWSSRHARCGYRYLVALLGGLLVAPALAAAPVQAAPRESDGRPPGQLVPELSVVTATVEPVIAGAGAITSTTSGLECANTTAPSADTLHSCSGDLGLSLFELAGLEQVVLEAVPAEGWVFAGWAAGQCSSVTGATCTLDSSLLTTVSGALQPVAQFLAEDDPAVCEVAPELPVCTPADTSAPETVLGERPTVDGTGSTESTSATFTFTAVETDEAGQPTTTPTPDATFECELTGPSGAHSWSVCASPKTYDALAPGAYTFSVRAKDAADPANTDQTPATFSWTVVAPDGSAPDVQLTGGPQGWWLEVQAKFTYFVTEAQSTATCALDGTPVTCNNQSATVRRYGAGTHTFTVGATDGQGNTDPTPASRTFTLPKNNTALDGKGWKRMRSTGSFMNTASVTTKKGATLSTKARGVREIALVVTKGRGFGTVKVMLGKKTLKKVSLAARHTKKRQLVPVKTFATGRSGTVRVVVLTQGKKVVVEGLGLRTG